MKYKLIVANSPEELSQRITEWLSTGWSLSKNLITFQEREELRFGREIVMDSVTEQNIKRNEKKEE